MAVVTRYTCLLSEPKIYRDVAGITLGCAREEPTRGVSRAGSPPDCAGVSETQLPFCPGRCEFLIRNAMEQAWHLDHPKGDRPGGTTARSRLNRGSNYRVE
eukprot:7624946-Pyramimonas_sp.AAC.1